MTRYPDELERAGLSTRGQSTFIRPIRPDDADRLVAFVGGLSRETLFYRSLGVTVRVRDDLIRRAARVDYLDELALVALLGEDIIGVARYVRVEGHPDRAEVAFTVRDDRQGEGLGRLLLERIAAAARERGIRILEADVLADNVRMIRVFEGAGFRVEAGPPGRVRHFDIAIDPQSLAVTRAERREHTAVRRSLRALLEPGSVAVVGANREPLTIGHEIVANLLRGGFEGPVYPVNPHAGEVAGLRAYGAVRELPEAPDLAVVAVRAESVPEVVRECAELGVQAVVVVSTGFGETGEAGRAAELELARFARASGMRLVGPNCMGVVNTTPAARLAATFSPALPPPGRVAMSSQSGPLGLTVLDLARRLGLGFSGFVSVGHAVDVSTNDLLQWWDQDPDTSVILLHLEHFGNPRRFARIARRIAAHKPIIAVHPGPADSSDGRSEATVSSLFAQSGVIRTRTLQELFDVGLLLAHQPPPQGNRVAIITNAGGPAALTAGACVANGLRIAALADLSPTATARDYRQALDALLADDGVDAAVVLFMPPLADAADEVASAILDASAAHPAKPVVASFLSRAGVTELLRRDDHVVPTFAFPESAAAALGHAAAYQAWRSRPSGVSPALPGLDPDRARALAAAHGPGPLPDAAAEALLDAYGIALGSPAPGPGTDAFLGVTTDPVFGPVITFGLTGEYADLMGDIAYRITPLSDRDAHEMVRSLRAAPLLSGVDLASVEETLLRISAMVEDLPEIAEMDLRPVRLLPPGRGVAISGARIQLSASRRVPNVRAERST